MLSKLGISLRNFGHWVKPKYYSDVCTTQGSAYSEYETLSVDWGRQDDYESIGKLGRGKYSEVYEGINVLTHQRVVIKMLKPVRTGKVQRELAIMKALKGGPNIIALLDVIKDRSSNTPSFILEYVQNGDFRVLYPQLTDFEVRYYMYELLKSLDFTHSKGIMHRDVKPTNVMIDHSKRLLRLIDWGLADFYIPGKEYPVRVASRYFKAPELLLNYTQYDYSMDMWSFGAMLAGLIFKEEPFFHGADNPDQLAKIVRVVGSEELYQYMDKFKITLEPQLYDGVLGLFPKKQWVKYITLQNADLANADAIDLLDKLLKIDHTERILPKDAMEHKYFSPVVDMWRKIEESGKFLENSPEFSTAKAIISERSQFKQHKA